MWMRITYIVVSWQFQDMVEKRKKVLKNAVVCPEYWYGNRSGSRFFSSNSKYLYYLDKNYHLKRYDKKNRNGERVWEREVHECGLYRKGSVCKKI